MDIQNALIAAAAAYAAKPDGLLSQLYKDAMSPGVQQLGRGIADCIELIRYPLQLISEKARLNLAASIEIYKERIKSKPVEQVASVPPEVGVPILESLMYVTNGVVREMFVNLLVSASDRATQGLAHPSFAHTISRLSPDDAQLLVHLVKDQCAPFVQIYFRSMDSQAVVPANFVLHIKDEDFALTYPGNVGVYVSNLASLGLIRKDDAAIASFDYLEHFRENFAVARAHAPSEFPGLQTENGHIALTDLGKMFASAVLPGSSERAAGSGDSTAL